MIVFILMVLASSYLGEYVQYRQGRRWHMRDQYLFCFTVVIIEYVLIVAAYGVLGRIMGWRE